MIKDKFGLDISTQSVKSAENYIKGIDIALAANANAEKYLEESSRLDPEFALPYGALALLYDMWGKPTLKDQCLSNAIKYAPNATRREQQHIKIIEKILLNEKKPAYDLLKQHVNEFPADAFIFSQITGAYSILAFSGNKDFEQERLFILERAKNAYHNDWWYDGMYAYSLTEVNEHKKAQELAERSLSNFYHNGHTAHTYSHVLYETNQLTSGENFLKNWFNGYDEKSPIAGHVRWHQALLEALQNRPEKAISIYHSHLKPSIATSPNYGKGIDAASLLWRISLKNNVIEQNLWNEIGDFFNHNFSIIGDPFLDIHKSITYHSLNNTSTIQFENDLNRFYTSENDETAKLVLEIDQIIKNHANLNQIEKNKLLNSILTELPRVGGSHAQRDLIVETLI